ncbi:MAG: gliding motility-associated C-terminal domain-containing protein [Bacteroidales bacterium]|nr:gliding motility-associated C-terminal domain-containing protein [Bacteroidales bacterium]
MKNFLFFFILIYVLLCVQDMNAEGIKELANGTTNYPETNFGSNGWTDPGAPDHLKLFIYIKDPTTESIYFGFSANSETYNIYDPNGVLVYSNTSNANAANVSEAITGPSQIVGAGGYLAQTYTPVSGSPAGNYYIEFDGAANMAYWDISVAKAGNNYTELGRVWSMIWWMNMGGWNASDSFEATVYAYSTEGFVSKVNYKGSDFRPYVFSIYYNASGPGNSGDLAQDRKSINGANAGTASFPVFLNPPPEEIMPSASFGDLVATPYVTRTAASGPNKYSFNLSSTQPGTFRILLNVENPAVPDVYDDVLNTTDRVLVFDIIPAAGETAPYIRSMPWDGIDGNGNILADGYLLHYTVSYADGRSNFPTYDAEYLYNGLSVNQVRPSNPYVVQLYWDDSNIPDATGDGSPKVELNGALSPAHTWSNADYGNLNTINTWWYCNVKQDTEQTVPLPAISTSAPTIQAHDIVFSEVGNSAVKINWTNGNGAQRLVFIKQTTTGQPFPVDNTTYAANTVFGLGNQIGTTGWFCVYNGASSPEVVVTGLADNTDYRVMVLEYNNGSGTELYNTNTAVINPANQKTLTITQATNVTFTNVLSNSFTVDWTNGTGTRRVAFIKLTATAGNALPINNTTYTASTVYGVGDQIGSSGWYCIYDGIGSNVDITNLAKATDYTVMVCEYFGSPGNENYLTVTNATDPNNQVTAALSPAHHLVFSGVTTNSFQVDWTDGDGIARQVFIKQTNSTTDEPFPVDGTTYTANPVYGSGQQIGTTGWFCVYDGVPSTVSISGLSPSTEYRVMVCDYTAGYNFIDGSVPTNPLNQATYGVTPTVQAHDITFPNTGATQMDINWINGNGTERIVFAKQINTGQPFPVNGTVYAANSGFGLGSEIGTTGWFCIYKGTGTSVTMNNILEGTEYRFMVCEFNQDATGPLYNTSTAVLNPENNTSLTAGINVSLISQHTTEVGGTATFTIVLNTQPTNDVVVGLNSDDTSEGTIAATDITFTSADWNTPKTITVTGQDDIVFDGNITYNIISAPAVSLDVKYNGINPNDVAVINDDDETAPTVTLSVSPANIAENGGVSTLTATLSTATFEDVIVNLTYSGTATGSGTDYNVATSITITAGNTTGTTDITAVNDAISEGDETVITDITSITGGDATENGTQQATVTITDDDGVLVTISASPLTIAENGGISTITATLDAVTFEDVVVNLTYSGTASNGTDYTVSTSVTITAGNTTGTTDITAINDATYEGNETVITDISSVTGGNATENGTQQITVTIDDNADIPSVTLSSSPASIIENGGVSTLTATLSNATYENVVVNLTYTGTATNTTDYGVANSITISAGSLTGTTDITAINDAIYEGNETVITDIASITGGGASESGTQQETVTIDDNADIPTVTLLANPLTIAENGGVSALTATLSNATYEDVVIDLTYTGTATGSGTDYNALTSITVSAGNTIGTIDITAVDDVIYEGSETVVADISNVTGGGASENGVQQETITIEDDDAQTNLSIIKIADNSNPEPGDNVVFTLTVTNSGPSDATGVTVTDNIPSGYTYVSDDGSGAYNAGTGIWAIGDIMNSGTAVLNITVTVNETGDYANTATVAGTEPDPDNTDNSDINTPTPEFISSMSITKVANLPEVIEEDAEITYTIEVTNTGNMTLYNIEITDDNADSIDGSPITSLSPGDSEIVTAIHIITNYDITAGQVINTAFGTGEDINGNEVTDESDDPNNSADIDNNGDGEPDDPTISDVIISEIQIPEGFSPNGDGINDIFVIKGLENYPGNSLIIFNRWGNKIFEASPYNNDWSGTSMFGITIGGNELPEGTYFYILQPTNDTGVIKGYIYLTK